MDTPSEEFERQLRELGQRLRAHSDSHEKLLEDRTELVQRAHDAGMTYREAANLLGITEVGLRKAQSARLPGSIPGTTRKKKSA
jgi:hypothetical protein